MTGATTSQRTIGSTGRTIGLVVTYVAAGVVGATMAGLLAVPDADVQRGLVLRAVLVGVLLVLVTLGTDRRRALPTLAAIAAVAYVLDPATWGGRALLAQLWLEPGPATILIDGIVWVALVVATAWAKRAVRGTR